MARARVKGTKDFLIMAIVLLVLAAWHFWDGWFPRAVILEKYPDPDAHFYTYNRVTAVLLFIGSLVCGYIHKVVK